MPLSISALTTIEGLNPNGQQAFSFVFFRAQTLNFLPQLCA
ncbi:hypothetical protein [Spirosoma endbachense]|nr:hypothetical protein [Spirosoma endbachense]